MKTFFLYLAAAAVLIVALSSLSQWVKFRFRIAYRNSKYGRRIRDQARKQQEYAEQANRYAAYKGAEKDIILTLNAIQHELYSSNEESTPKNRREHIWHIVEVLALVAAAIVGVAAIIIGTWDAGQQRTLMQSQVEEMRNEKRAWVSLGIQFVKGPVYSHFRYTFDFKYRITNTGQSPALNVTFEHFHGTSESHSDEAAKAWLEDRTAACEKAKRKLSEQDGIAIFPGDKPVEISFSETTGGPPPQKGNTTQNDNSFQFGVFGCVLYRTVDNVIHQTPYFYLLKVIVPSNYPFESPLILDIPLQQNNPVQIPISLIAPTTGMPSPD